MEQIKIENELKEMEKTKKANAAEAEAARKVIQKQQDEKKLDGLPKTGPSAGPEPVVPVMPV